MANKRPKPEEMVTKLRQVEVLVGQGMKRVDAIRETGVVEQTFYRWRKQYGGMGHDQVKELKRLQKENERCESTSDQGQPSVSFPSTPRSPISSIRSVTSFHEGQIGNFAMKRCRSGVVWRWLRRPKSDRALLSQWPIT